MDLDLSAEQEMLRDMVRNVCGSYASLETVRALEDDPVGYPAELWKQMAALDLIGLMVPAEYGGSGMSALEGAVVYMELGRSLAPTPHFVSAVMAAGVLVRSGSADQQRVWLPKIVTGDAIVTTAWLEPGNGYGPRGVQVHATPDGDHVVLDGSKTHVPFASAATAMIVLARTGTGERDVDLFLVDATQPGLTMNQQLSLASDTQYDVALSGVRVPASARIGRPGTGWDVWQATLLDGIVFLAAQAVGGARHALDITVQYAKDREQFGKPLGAFQAIAHYLSDAVTAVDGAETLVLEAAWAAANGQSIERLAPMAKLFACKTFRDVTAMCQQVFGGVGFTLDYDIQLFFRRAKQLQISWWDDRSLEELIAATVLDPRSGPVPAAAPGVN
ncbi:MAG TPA: acyl-CoA dehydrogenase family protein [Acidimicrobiia bacterium]|nr:acyl-CoA dehydrogenase family protein [Acidimicrobiia bacterium]